MLEQRSKEGDPEIWRHVRGDLAEVQADRLLNPAWSGSLLDRATAREKMATLGMTLGVFQLPGMPFRVTMSVATSIADLQLTVSTIDFTETCEGRWGRLRAILAASQMFGLPPTRFLTEYDGAQEYILRLYSSPVEFRAHQTQRIDEKHPDIVGRRVQALRDAFRQEAARQLRQFNTKVRIEIGFPIGEDYWAMRAWWLQSVEAQIQRVWPGQGQGVITTQASTNDA